MDQNTHDVSGDSEAMLSFFGCSKFSVWVYNTSHVQQGKHSRSIDWKYNYHEWCYIIRIKQCFPRTPCDCDLFVSEVTKITRYMDVRFWQSFFCAFSVCDVSILKSTTHWLLKLSVLYIHSFIQVNNTTFQIKTVFNNVLFSTEVHNPLHAHLLALSHVDTLLQCCGILLFQVVWHPQKVDRFVENPSLVLQIALHEPFV